MKISKSTIKTIVFIFGLFTNISSFASQDTLLIKRKNKKYSFEYKGIKDTITENGLIIIDENSNFHYFIDNWKHHFDKKEKQIIIPIVIHTNPFNNSFYSSNFSGIKESLDSSVYYNSFNLGNYIIKFDKKKTLI